MTNCFAHLLRAVDRFFLEPIDARVYALVRMAYGVAALAVVIDLWPVRVELLSDAGMFGRVRVFPWFHPLRWVVSEAGITALLVAIAIVAVSLASGLMTRLCSILLVVWSVSYSNVAFVAEGGFDAVVRVVGSAFVLAPTTRRWALDRVVFGPGKDRVSRHALRLLQWQLVVLYFETVWLKAPDRYWRNGELIAYFMTSMFSRFPSSEWAHYGRFSTLLTWGTLVIEATVPVLLWNRRTRLLAFMLGLLLHGTIAIMSTVALFSLTLVPLYLAFLEESEIEAFVACRPLAKFSRIRGT